MSSIIHQAVTSLKAGVPNACSITVTTQCVIAVDLCLYFLYFCVLKLISVKNSQERGTNKQRKACTYRNYDRFAD